MATAVWQDDDAAGADGDWANTSNWVGGGGAGGVPANSDTVIIAQGARAIDTNLTTGLTGITLRIGSGFSGAIGSASSWLDIDGGTFDFDAGGGVNYLAGTWTTVQVLGGIGSPNMMNWKATTDTDIGTLRCLGGNGTLTIGANAVLDDVEISGANSLTVVIDKQVTSLDTIEMSSGNVTCGASIATSLEVRGGDCTIRDAAACPTIDIKGDGRILWNSSGRPGATNLVVWNGIFTGVSNPNNTVTAPGAMTVNGGRVDLRNGMATFIGWAWTYNGGVVLPPQGSTVTLS